MIKNYDQNSGNFLIQKQSPGVFSQENTCVRVTFLVKIKAFIAECLGTIVSDYSQPQPIVQNKVMRF